MKPKPRWQRCDTHGGPKKIDYAVSIDRAFLGFAADCGVEAERLFAEAEQSILFRHHEAAPDRTMKGEIRPGAWCLDFGPASVIYTVQDQTAYVQDYLCKANGQSYEPSQDLLAGLVSHG